MKLQVGEEQIIQILQEGEAGTKAEVCRQYGISEWTYSRWRQRYQGPTVAQARRLKEWRRRTPG